MKSFRSMKPAILALALACSTVTLFADDTASPNVLSPADNIVGVKQTAKGKPNILSTPGDYGGMEGNDEAPAAAIDGDIGTKTFNHTQDGSQSPGVNTGVVITPKAGATVVTGIALATANDLEDRDPVKIVVEGSNDPKATEAGTAAFTVIYEGPSGLDSDPGRGAWGKTISFDNTTAYTSYRILVTATRNATDSTQYGEIKLLGKPAAK